MAMIVLALALTSVAAEKRHLLFQLRQSMDVDGRTHQLGQQPGLKAVVLVFLGPECPISQRYVPELNRISAGRSTNTIQFFGVVSAPSITRTQAAAFASEY
jgi:hypothetical protein